jgi:hypothetical protein
VGLCYTYASPGLVLRTELHPIVPVCARKFDQAALQDMKDRLGARNRLGTAVRPKAITRASIRSSSEGVAGYGLAEVEPMTIIMEK